ncbi:MAG TPA: hypothetical protein VHE35_35120 [Kofleriaceae bacterium]|nr:hypothetical protein [Kofleriaceae bacterium]
MRYASGRRKPGFLPGLQRAIHGLERHLVVAPAGADLRDAAERLLERAAVVANPAAFAVGDIGDEAAVDAAGGRREELAVVAVGGTAGHAARAGHPDVGRDDTDVDTRQPGLDLVEEVDERGRVGGEDALLAAHRRGVGDDEQEIQVGLRRAEPAVLLDQAVVRRFGQDDRRIAAVGAARGGERGDGERDRGEQASTHSSTRNARTRPARPRVVPATCCPRARRPRQASCGTRRRAQPGWRSRGQRTTHWP